ncbi:M48 family metalloprotease [Sedimentitalea todarodis]|uniref:M48 family metalloprotease n=1 Tax=Sedimentitalea todarodis TaxID=1631240 RepID=A0ABU3VFW0_9RHOB|nr:M48 family metalloprotease [Sedimentitalea todarodis]MDU9005058.1 M48 family metalloprotease [Sedimentitalea todarodis]
MRSTVLLSVMALLLVACDVAIPTAQPPMEPTEWVLTPEEAARSFTEVVRAVEPVAERECRRRGTVANCDFLIAVDPNPRAQPNAFQSQDAQGRPVLTFTASLIGSVHNADEMAFVMGHEAAHHIANHLDRQRRNSADAAEIFGGLATLTGGGTGDVERAKEIGAVVGARTYAKEFELEADELGTVITWHAGYDPLIGALFFTRIPDPGDKFLGTHPPNKARMDTVAQTVRSLGG